MIIALYVCACGYQQNVQVRIDERVTVAHDCRLSRAALDLSTALSTNDVDNVVDEIVGKAR